MPILAPRGKAALPYLRVVSLLSCISRYLPLLRLGSIALCLLLTRNFLFSTQHLFADSWLATICRIFAISEVIYIIEHAMGFFAASSFLDCCRYAAHIWIAFCVALPSSPFMTTYMMVSSVWILADQLRAVVSRQDIGERADLTYRIGRVIAFVAEQVLAIAVCVHFLMHATYNNNEKER